MNTPVNFLIAKMLKEKGYPQLNKGLYYTKDKEHCLVGWGFNDRTENSFAQYSAPTIAEVVMWLYEKHGIWVTVNLITEKILNASQDGFFYEINGKGWETEDIIYSEEFNSPTEAYEAAIEYTLNELI